MHGEQERERTRERERERDRKERMMVSFRLDAPFAEAAEGHRFESTVAKLVSCFIVTIGFLCVSISYIAEHFCE